MPIRQVYLGGRRISSVAPAPKAETTPPAAEEPRQDPPSSRFSLPPTGPHDATTRNLTDVEKRIVGQAIKQKPKYFNLRI